MIANPLAKINSTGIDSSLKIDNKKISGEEFKGLLQNEISKPTDKIQSDKPAALDNGLKFSNHAIDRIQSRKIQFQPGDMQKLGEAVEKANDKGSKNALVLMGDNAFVVSVKNKTIVTAMDKSLMKENIFTNIDSTIVL